MQTRNLGKNGPAVSGLGLGCMGMSFAYGPADEAESLHVLHRYLDLGGNFLDTAEIYGPFKNEELLATMTPARFTPCRNLPSNSSFLKGP